MEAPFEMANSVNKAENIAGKRVLVMGGDPIGFACALWSCRLDALRVLLAERIWARMSITHDCGFFPVSMQIRV